MSKGKTFSITVPLPLFAQLESEAKTHGISRSKHVYNILQNHYQKPSTDGDLIDARCGHKYNSGICSYYGTICVLDTIALQQTCDNFQNPNQNKDIEDIEGNTL